MNNPIYLRQSLSNESALKGELKGVAYTGGVIPQYAFYENFVVDLATLTIASEKLPLLKDHDMTKVAGHGKATLSDNSISIEGKISTKTTQGQEIIGLAEDGFEWQMSIGVFDGVVEEIKDEEVNGNYIERGFVLRNGVLREVSIVSLGADKDTSATILSKQKGESNMITMSPEAYAKLACACGGNKDTKPEELAKLAEETTEAVEEKVKALEEEKAALEEKIKELEAAIEAVKEEEEIEKRVEEIEMAAKEKGITFSIEKVKQAAVSKEATQTLISLISDMKQEGKIDPKLTAKMQFDGKPAVQMSSEERSSAINQMIKEGKAKTKMEAILKLQSEAK